MAVTLIVTRPAAQAAQWVQQLQALGQAASALPLIGVQALADSTALIAAWQRLPSLALLVFVSPNAVQHFFAARPSGAGHNWPLTLLAGSTGPGTTAALHRAGVPAAQVVEPDPQAQQFDSEALWRAIQHRQWAGQRVAVVRGEDGRDWLADVLREQGALLEFIAAYQRVAPLWSPAEEALLLAAQARPGTYLWLFSSSQALAELARLAPAADWSTSRAMASHPRIVQAARAAGFGMVQSVAPSPQAVLNRLRDSALHGTAAMPDADPPIQFKNT